MLTIIDNKHYKRITTMKQVFFAEPMEESIMGHEIYEVVRIGKDGERLLTAHSGMPKEEAEKLARELNEGYNE